jgi:cytochrome P450
MTALMSKEWGEGIPGPSPVPLLGLIPFLLRFGFHPLESLEDLRKKYGNLVRLDFGKYPAVFVFDTEYNRQVLRDPDSFYVYDTDIVPVKFPKDSSVKTVTTGMPLMNGPRHHDHRTALLPYFHKKFVTRYHDSCVDVTERLVAGWKIGNNLDMRAEMQRLAMWLATAPVLGLDPEKEGEAIGRQLEHTMGTLFNPFTLLLPYDVPGLPFRSLLTHAGEMERVVRAVIARKKEEGLNGEDVLSVMIRMHEENPERMSEQELIGHTTTMFRGGYNPNGMALYWTIFLLSQHPEALKTVLNEIEHAMDNGNPTPESLDRIPSLEGAIKEAMRLFPAGTWTGRRAVRDFELGGHSLPNGTWIVLSPHIIHRIPEIFPDPYHFRPERWLSEYHSAYEFMPFSAGPRYCIGTSLGMVQLKVALSILLRRFSFTLKPGMKVECSGLNSIRPKNGLPMTVNERSSDVPSSVPCRGNIHRIVHFS